MAKNGKILSSKTFLLKNACYRRYFTGLDIAEGIILVGKVNAYFLDARYYFAFDTKIKEKGFVPVLYNGIETLKNFIKEQNISSLYLDFPSVTLSEYKEYKTFGVTLRDGSNALKEMRAIKNEFELDSIKKACYITEKSFYETLQCVKEGITELEFKTLLEENYIKNGASGPAFSTIVAFNENSAIPHHETSGAILKPESVILVDTGCIVNGYMSDYTRTFYFGKHPPNKFVKSYEAVLTANEIVLKNVKSGMLHSEIDALARDYLDKQGLKEYFTHSLGHGVGLEIHEYPTLSYRSTRKIRNGTVFTVEPGVYFNKEFGIRIEDTVCLINGKAERLFKDEKNLLII